MRFTPPLFIDNLLLINILQKNIPSRGKWEGIRFHALAGLCSINLILC